MSRQTILILLGLLVAASPYLGLPLSVLAVILPLIGLGICAIGFTLRLQQIERLRSREVPVPYDAKEV